VITEEAKTEAKAEEPKPEKPEKPEPKKAKAETKADTKAETKAEESKAQTEESSQSEGQVDLGTQLTLDEPAGEPVETVQHASNEEEVTLEPEPEATEPVVEAAEEVVAAAETGNGQVAHEAPDTDMICQECGDPIESEDQRDLALIRFRKRLDRKCFLSAKKAKA
jgi:hypothetical protein